MKKITGQHVVLYEAAGIPAAELRQCGHEADGVILIDPASECWQAVGEKWKTRHERAAVAEAERLERLVVREPVNVPAPWTTDQPSRGMGDVVAKLTHAIGIDRVVETVAAAVGKPCGCGKRQEQLNELMPFGGQEQPSQN